MIRLLSIVILLSFDYAHLAAGETIGSAYANGNYFVDGSSVRGSSTLFEGTKLELGDPPAMLQLRHGARVWLAPRSRITVYAERLLLSKGLGQIEGSSDYALQVSAVQVLASSSGALVRLKLDDDGGAVVAPLRGSAEVSNARGIPVGNVPAGRTVKFQPQSGDTAAVALNGCLFSHAGNFGLTDDITNLSVRLQGSGLASFAGHPVQLTGVIESVGGRREALTVVVKRVRRLGSGTCQAPGSGTGLFALAALSNAGPQQPQAVSPQLSIVIVEGNGAINNSQAGSFRSPVVRVEGADGRPVAGARVTFAAPDSGPGATFANGAHTVTVTTDADGRAVAHGFKPNREVGAFQIAVTATYSGLTARTTVSQSNARGAGAGGVAATGAASGGGSNVAIIGGVMASAAVGALAISLPIVRSESPETPASR